MQQPCQKEVTIIFQEIFGFSGLKRAIYCFGRITSFVGIPERSVALLRQQSQ